MIRKQLVLAEAVVSLLLGASVAAAATLGKGASELTGTAGFASVGVPGTHRSITTVSTDVGYGFCLSGNWEVLPTITLLNVSEGGSSASNYGVTLSAVYHLPAPGSSVVPYLRAGAGLSIFPTGFGGK